MGLSTERAAELLSAFKTKTIVVVGDVFLDGYINGKIERQNPESSVVHLLRVSERKPVYNTGGAGNVAHNLAALGAKKVFLLSVCGNDDVGRRLQLIAASEGYKPLLVKVSKRETIVKFRYGTSDGQLLRVDMESDNDIRLIDANDAVEMLEQFSRCIETVDGVLVSDYAKGVMTEKLAYGLLDITQKYKTPVLADVKPANIGYFVGVTMIAPNLKEASASIGNPAALSIEEVAKTLVRRIQTEVFLTASEKGICIADKERAPFLVPQTHKITISDTSGCGDTAAAAILLSRLCGATPKEAAELANAAAAVVVTKVGAYAPKPEEVLRMLSS